MILGRSLEKDSWERETSRLWGTANRIVAPGNFLVAETPGHRNTDADARLIAAAPELLAAAKDALAEADRLWSGNEYKQRWLGSETRRLIVAAIAKAEGES